MKVVFLDIDGVINTDRIARYRKNHDIDEMVFDEEAMNNLQQIVTNTGSKIVISSTWRIHYNTTTPLWVALVDNLEKYGLEQFIVGITPVEDGNPFSKPRRIEIKEWLDEHPEVDTFVILDDEWDMGELTPHFVRCAGSIGISSANCEEAIAILNHKND